MSVYFAAARSVAHSPVARALARRTTVDAANDNGASALASDRPLSAALRHFAVHGLAAAREAHRQAEQAAQRGDGTGYRHWLEICRALDRRLAAALERQTGETIGTPFQG